MRKITFIFLGIGILSISNVCTKYNDEDYKFLDEKMSTNGGGGGNTDCPDEIVGEWSILDPTSCGAQERQQVNFYCDGTGQINSPDCNNVCNPGLWWNFTYEASGGVGTLHYTPNNPHISCGVAVPDATTAPVSFTYSVSGTTLTTSFGVYNKP